MNARLSHIKFNAVFLLVVCVFMTTPTQLWHFCDGVSEADFHEEHTLVIKQAGSLGSVCAVCDHEYDTFIGDHFFDSLSVSVRYLPNTGCSFSGSVLSSYTLRFSARGPPCNS